MFTDIARLLKAIECSREEGTGIAQIMTCNWSVFGLWTLKSSPVIITFQLLSTERALVPIMVHRSMLFFLDSCIKIRPLGRTKR